MSIIISITVNINSSLSLYHSVNPYFVQEAMIKTIPLKKFRKAKWLSEEALQIAEKTRDAKAKEKRKGMPI